MMKKEALIVFVRKPELGKVKTRLAATIGDAAALDVYKRLLHHTFEVTQQSPADKFIFYAGEIVENDAWQAGCTKLLQQEADLGNRMKAAFETVLQKGYEKAVIIGSDCPGLTDVHLEKAFRALDRYDIAIGPARDGGYYLLGMKTMHPQLFGDIAWSTPHVYAKTVSIMERSFLRFHALEMLSDVDEEKDVPRAWLNKEEEQ